MLLTGCQKRPRQTTNSNVLEEFHTNRSSLEQAVDMLSRIELFERGPANANVATSLRAQLAEEKPLKDWEPDAMISRLPRNLRELPPLKQLDALELQFNDVLYLEEAILLRRIGDWVKNEKPPEELAKWLESPPSGLTREQADDLAASYLLFDWTVRNIQLDPLLETPKDVVGPAGGAVNMPAPLRGLPGPGYMALPWYTAMIGHGDAWQRARLFILLARQQGIEAVMLATGDSSETSKTRPWACGVLLGESLYLFDTAIGLPIAGPHGEGIATLAQVRGDSELLRQLDIDKEHLYEVSSDDVKDITALVDASLEALSQRMQLFERGLAGDRQLKLAVQPSDLAARLRKSPGIAAVALWSVPIDATLFEASLRENREFNPQLREAIFNERLPLEQHTGLSVARYKHLKGEFSNSPGKQGAKSLYVEARIPDAAINALGTDRGMQQQLGIEEELKSRKDPRERNAYIQSIQDRMRRGKQDSSYWLALAHYETGDYETAINWLDTRTIKADAKFWLQGAHYNLGRTYEQLGAKQLAEEQYLAVEGPAQLGALMRAKALSKK
jgi:hypothetical protein